MSRASRRNAAGVRPHFALLAVIMLLGGCGAGDKAPKRPPPLVSAAPPVQHRFVDRIEAVGTARANEQVTLAAPVTERVTRLLFEDGMAVRRGQLLAVLSQAQERATLIGAMAAEQEAAGQLRRIAQLNTRGFATQTLLDTQTASAERARAAAAEARAQIADREIRAPFSGHVSLRTISEGAIVSSGTPLVTISDLSRIKLDFTVPETMLASLQVGQPIRAVAAAYPDQPFAGVISHIDPVIDAQSRAILVRASIPNPGARIKPGMLMAVTISTATRDAMAVPELAVVGDGAGRFVFLLTPEGKAKRTKVTTGLRDQGLIEVVGLTPGARVIGEGIVKVTDGIAVRVADPAKTKREASAGAGAS